MHDSSNGAGLSADREFASLLNRLEQSRRGATANAKLGAADARILWLLSGGEEYTLRDISDKLSLEQSTVNRQVNAAVKAGYVEKRRSRARAAWVFSPSADGRRKFDADLDMHLGFYSRALAELSQSEQQVFIELLTRVVGGYETAIRTESWSRI